MNDVIASPLFCASKKIILARHGETVWNRDRLIMGRSDSALTPEGVDLAGRVARIIEKEGVQAVYSSSLGRAVSSATIYAEKLGIPITTKDELMELSCGEWEGCRLQNVKPGHRSIRETWQERPPGGESYQDAESRIGSFIRETCFSTSPKTILVVSHAGANRVFLKLWRGLDPDFAIKIECLHSTVFILNGTGQILARSIHAPDTDDLPLKRK